MKLASLEAALQRRPFRPFETRTDGEVLPIADPEQVFLAENKTTVIVDAPDRLQIMDLDQLTKLTLLKRGAQRARKAGPSA